LGGTYQLRSYPQKRTSVKKKKDVNPTARQKPKKGEIALDSSKLPEKRGREGREKKKKTCYFSFQREEWIKGYVIWGSITRNVKGGRGTTVEAGNEGKTN